MYRIIFGILFLLFSFNIANSANIQVGTRSDSGIIQNGGIDSGQIKTFEMVRGQTASNQQALYLRTYNVNGTLHSNFRIGEGDAFNLGNRFGIQKTIDLNNGYYMVIFYTSRDDVVYNSYYTIFNANKTGDFGSYQTGEIDRVLIDRIRLDEGTSYNNRSLHLIEEEGNFFIGFGNTGETKTFYDINNKVLVNKTIDLVNEELKFDDLLSNYFEINFVGGVFVLKDIVNTVEFFGINTGTGFVVKFGQIFSDLTTNTRLFINNFDISDNSLTMSISFIGDNTYSVYVPLDGGAINTTNIIENQFFAGLSEDLYFYDSRLLTTVKSNKDYVWLGVTVLNGIKYVTWFDENDGVWYIDDNNEGVQIYADDGSLYPTDGSIDGGGGGGGNSDDIESIFDIDRDGDGDISIIESGLALFTIAQNIIGRISELIDLLKNFIETFFSIGDTEGGQGFSFIETTNAFSVTDTIATMGTNAEETGLMKFNKSLFWLVLFIVFLMIVGLFFIN